MQEPLPEHLLVSPSSCASERPSPDIQRHAGADASIITPTTSCDTLLGRFGRAGLAGEQRGADAEGWGESAALPHAQSVESTDGESLEGMSIGDLRRNSS
eukprot:6058195-Prymnesium_polylepis.3